MDLQRKSEVLLFQSAAHFIAILDINHYFFHCVRDLGVFVVLIKIVDIGVVTWVSPRDKLKRGKVAGVISDP